VADLAVKIRAPPTTALATATFTPTPPSAGVPYQPPAGPAQPPQQPVAAPVAPVPPVSAPAAAVSIDSLFGKGALATLLARQSATPQGSSTGPSQPPPALTAIRSPPPPARSVGPPTQPAVPPPSNPLALLGMLRQAGLLPAAGTPAAGSSIAPPRPP